ncbi:MAG: hypothetical protein ABIH22_03635, partial [Candidatus Margulisiibacteriota bacterium]
VMGMEVINVPGATGYLDTNYVGKAKYALNALKRNDIVFVHVESPDEAGHEGSIRKKIRAIEDFDRYVVGTVLRGISGKIGEYKGISGRGFKVMVLPDHPTPIKAMTHTSDAVPFVIYQSKVQSPCLPTGTATSNVKSYNEKEIKKSKLKIRDGHKLLKVFLRKNVL